MTAKFKTGAFIKEQRKLYLKENSSHNWGKDEKWKTIIKIPT